MKVLIGIATRNRASILPRAIRSALEQDYAEKEIAVFDDASTDETPHLQSRFPNVRWFRAQTHQGLIQARNHLMRETDAAFYCSLDDDAWFIRRDEISLGLTLMREHPEVAGLAYDVLSPDFPNPRERVRPYRTHTYIGCGHILRLSAVREVGYYTVAPGLYGAEEKDLCVRLLDRKHEILLLPGVHVWHDKAMQSRDLVAQHRSGVCNDLTFALRRCPSPMVYWLLPGKLLSHLRFALRHNLTQPCLSGISDFVRNFPSLARSRKPVSRYAFIEYLRRSHAKL
jgi:glycosyltransferase involved in cell wall biosynthesis